MNASVGFHSQTSALTHKTTVVVKGHVTVLPKADFKHEGMFKVIYDCCFKFREYI